MSSIAFIGGTGFIGKSFGEYFCKNSLNSKLTLISRTPELSLGGELLNRFLTASINVQPMEEMREAVVASNVIIYGADSTRAADYQNKQQSVTNTLDLVLGLKGVDFASKRVVLLSSGAVYGKQAIKAPIKEDFSFNNFSDPGKNYYALLKIRQERLLSQRLFANQLRSAAILRLFSFHGKWLHDSEHFLLNQIQRAALEGVPLKVKNSQTYRSYMSADCLARIIFNVAVGTSSFCCNVGSSESRSIQAIAASHGVDCDLSGATSDLDYYIPDMNLFKRLGIDAA